MVPEDENKPGPEKDSEDEKVKIDDQEVSDSSVKSNQKVELDLDDAPFLDWEEDSEEEESAEEQKGVAEDKETQKEEDKKSKESVLVRIKRWWWVWAAAAAVVIISVSVVMWFASVDDTQKRKLPQAVEDEEPKASGKNRTKQMKKVSLEPFWVEYNTDNTYTQFHLGIDLSLQGEKTAWELEKKIPVIRDSLYYFLKNKHIDEISDKNNIKDLKKEISNIVNNNLSNGKVDQVLVQKYLVE